MHLTPLNYRAVTLEASLLFTGNSRSQNAMGLYNRIVRSLCIASLLSFVGSATLAEVTPQKNSLPRPPGAHLVMLPRAPKEKPQETSVAVNPRDPRNVIVSYHESLGPGSDHDPSSHVSSHVAWSANGGETWAIASGGTTDKTHVR